MLISFCYLFICLFIYFRLVMHKHVHYLIPQTARHTAKHSRRIVGYVRKMIDGSSVFSCLSDCIDETTFTCRTAEFHSPSATCYLKIDTYATQPWFYEAHADYTLYQRDCAF